MQNFKVNYFWCSSNIDILNRSHVTSDP